MQILPCRLILALIISIHFYLLGEYIAIIEQVWYGNACKYRCYTTVTVIAKLSTSAQLPDLKAEAIAQRVPQELKPTYLGITRINLKTID